jgi:hypothetical protein
VVSVDLYCAARQRHTFPEDIAVQAHAIRRACPSARRLVRSGEVPRSTLRGSAGRLGGGAGEQ